MTVAKYCCLLLSEYKSLGIWRILVESPLHQSVILKYKQYGIGLQADWRFCYYRHKKRQGKNPVFLKSRSVIENLFQEYHLFCFSELTGLDSIEINTGSDCLSVSVVAIPFDLKRTGRFGFVDQIVYLLPQNIKD